MTLLTALAPAALADVITGQVVDPNGVGVAGVDIDVKSLTGGGTPPIFNDGTDASGFFTTTLPAGIYRVTFTPTPPPASPLLIVEVPSVVVVGTTIMGVVTLPAGVVLSGRVLNGQGFPVAGVNIDVIEQSTGVNLNLTADATDAFGLFAVAVPAGDLELRLNANPVFGQTLASKALTLTAAGDTHVGDIALFPGVRISATVTGPSGFPLPDVDTDTFDALTGAKLYTPSDNTDSLGLASVVVPVGGSYDFRVCPSFASRLVAWQSSNLLAGADIALGPVALEAGVVISGKVLGGFQPLAQVDVDVDDPVTGLSVPLCGDNSSGTGSYAVVVPTGTWDVQFQPPPSLPFLALTHSSVLVTSNKVLHAFLPPKPGSPVIASVSPSSGAFAGGTVVTLSGQDFIDDGATQVTFGGLPAPIVSITAPTALVVTSPPGTPGASVDVTVSGSFGSGTLAAGFRYQGLTPPQLSSVAPASGLFHQATPVTLTGSDFDPLFGLTVTFGGVPATGVTFISSTTVLCVAPTGAQGQVADVVLTQNGLTTTLAAAFTWTGTTLTSVSPAVGHPLGGTQVTLSGLHFAGDGTTAVTFGAAAATLVSVAAPETIVVTSPPGTAGAAVAVTVTDANGIGTLAGAFTYADPQAPVLASIVPASGLFHQVTPVTLTGTDFDPLFGLTVTFGGLAATNVTFVSTTQVTCVAPAGVQGQVADVVLTQNGHTTTLPAAFAWFGTTLAAVSPAGGHPLGGTQVTLSGAHLAGDGSTAVTFGAALATIVSLGAPNTIVVTSPPGTAGAAVAVTVTDANGTGTLAGAFTYADPQAPVLASVVPASGLFHQVTPVTLTGTDFDPLFGLTVTFGGLAATNVTFVSTTQVTCVAPAGVQGQVADVVLTQNGKTTTLPAAFAWIGTTLTSISPAVGHPLGGTQVTLSGAHFAGDSSTSVSFGAVAATVVSLGAPDTIVVSSPPGAVGAPVAVTVTDANGTGTLAGAFTYIDPQAPVLASIVPASGLFHQATPVTLTGANFDPLFGLTVTFGGVAATGVTFVSPTTITCVAPAGVQGQVGDVTLTQNGKTTTLPAAFAWFGTTLTAVLPAGGHPLGGTQVTLSGLHFAGDGTTAVTFGAAAATIVSLSAPDTIVVISPPGTAGAVVDVTVSDGNGVGSLAGAFTYIDPQAPMLASVLPASGLFHQTTPVTLSGANFDSLFGLTVTFGGVAAANVTVVSPTTVTCQAPAGAQDQVSDVTLTQNGHAVTLPAAFTWFGSTLAAVSPAVGHPLGGTQVTLSGSHFAGDASTSVTIGGTTAAVVSLGAPDTIGVISPPGTAGAVVDVTITDDNGSSSLAGAFTYADPQAPVLTGLQPAAGLFHQATAVTLSGSDFDPLFGLTVTFGGVAATGVTFVSPTQVACLAPAGTQGQVVDVALTQNGHTTTLPAAFSYLGTTLSSLSPDRGPPVGTPPVTLSGSLFPEDGSLVVTFGLAPAAVLTVSDATVLVQVPAGPPAATVDVVVTGTHGTATLSGGFTYESARLLAVTPATGPSLGGPPVTLTGEHFADDGSMQVSFGNVPATVLQIDGPGNMQVTLPPGPAGATVDVHMTSTNGADTLAGAFTFAITTVASAHPLAGPPAGGDIVTLTGAFFLDDGSTHVFFGPAEASILSIEAPHTIVVAAPPGLADAVVDITVSSAQGVGTLPAGHRYGDFGLLLGDSIVGTIDAADTDTIFFDAPAGSRVTLVMKRSKGGLLQPRMRLVAPDGTELLPAAASALKPTLARVRKLTLPQTGSYRLELTGAVGSTGPYRFRSKAKYPVKYTQLVAVTPQATVAFEAMPGWLLKVAKVKAKKVKGQSFTLQPAVALSAPGGSFIDLTGHIKTNKAGTSVAVFKTPLAQLGTYRLQIQGAFGTTGPAKVNIGLKRPKQKKTRFQE